MSASILAFALVAGAVAAFNPCGFALLPAYLGLLVVPANRRGDVALIAVHAFDCHGANAAGLTTGWARRHERHYGDVFTPADVTGENLVEVADGLLAATRPLTTSPGPPFTRLQRAAAERRTRYRGPARSRR